jgi:hypothetical protein
MNASKPNSDESNKVLFKPLWYMRISELKPDNFLSPVALPKGIF